MKILNLTLEHIRNHGQLSLPFEQNLTCIIGPNAQGKTNILEALYTLALSKSFRTNRLEELINWEHEFGRINSQILQENDEKIDLEVFLGRSPQPKKSFKKNGVKGTVENFIGTLKVVLFHPEDLNMLYLGPDLRRKYLDILNIQVSRSYFSALKAYKKALEQRNALLKSIKAGFSQKSELHIWNEPLAQNGLALIIERSKTIAFLQTRISEYYQKIAQTKDQITLNYHHIFTSNQQDSEAIHMLLKGSESIPPHHYTQLLDIYHQELENSLMKDLSAQYTTMGPHRDDLLFHLNGHSLQSCASRGEYRSVILALKLLEMRCIEEATTEKPVLLLDDVFSELDFSRQEMLIKAIQEHQSLITTTHLDNLKSLKDIKIFDVGKLKI